MRLSGMLLDQIFFFLKMIQDPNPFATEARSGHLQINTSVTACSNLEICRRAPFSF